MTLKVDDTSGNRVGDMNWIDMAQDRDRWQTLVNAVRNVRVL